VSDYASPTLPAWVYKRDGQLVPFEADKLCQALFAASEALGRPDAFLARELTDSILHFLAAETTGSVPTTAQVADLAAKVVRELGHPALARAYMDAGARPASPPGVPFHFAPTDPPAAVTAACLRTYSLHAVFSRDLAGAQADGLLTLCGLDAPLALAGCVLGPAGLEDSAAAAGVLESLADVRDVAGVFVALDSPDHALSRTPDAGEPATYLAQLHKGLEALGWWGTISLNSAVAPAWAEDEPGGPLFGPRRPPAAVHGQAATAAALLGCFLGQPHRPRLRIEWHLGERDFSAGGPAPGVLLAARAAAASAAVSFAFDRPRRPVLVGPGMDRKHPAVLQVVGLHLPRLAELPGAGADPSVFLQKLASLARLALSAGVQKRAFLRKHSRAADGAVSGVGRGFLLERARLVVVPVGLEEVVRRLTGHGLCAQKASLEVARQILQRLGAVLEGEGAAAGLDAVVDGLGGRLEEWDRPAPESPPDAAAHVGGLTPWDESAALRSQVRAAGLLHAVAGGGTAVVVLPAECVLSTEEVVDLLHLAWRQTDVARLRLMRIGRQKQLTLPGLQ
jgi:hypothetical protein